MCTKEEAKEATNKAVEELLFTPDVNGHTRFGREVHDAIFEDGNGGGPSRFQRELKKAFYTTFGKWFFGGGAIILLGLAGLYFQVNQHEEILTEGGRYTEADAIQDNRLQESRDARQDQDIQDLRSDVNDGFRDVNNKLDRIIDKLLDN